MAEKKTKKSKDEKKDQGKAKVYETNKEYPDRTKDEAAKFPEFNITILEAKTILLLLRSEENEVLLRALNHLSNYAENLPENAINLHNLNALKIILENKLWEHEFLFIKRFALKLLADIIEHEDVNIEDESLEQLFAIAREYYINSMDNFIIEYSSTILLHLLREPRICAALEDDPDFINVIYRHLKETNDPDILYNSYNILVRLLKSITSILQICAIESFPFERVLGDVSSIYPEIQKAALETLSEVLLCQNEFYESRFICSMFFEEMFKVLENDLWEDKHKPIIEIFRRLMTNERIAKVFCRDEYLPRYVSYVKQKEKFKIYALEVLVEISQYEDQLEGLFLLSVVSIMLDFLKDLDQVNGKICLGIKRMLRQPDSFNKIVRDDPTPHLLQIIKSNTKTFEDRIAAADTLNDILKRSFKSAESAIDNGITSILSHILSQDFAEIPTDFLLNSIQILISLAKYPEIREKVMVDDLPKTLTNALKSSLRSAILTTNLFNCAAAYICEETFKDEFLRSSMMATVLKALKNPGIIVKNSAADFIVISGKIPEFSEEYIDKEILKYLLEDDVALSTCPNWSPAIEAILSKNPTIKFLVKGRLEITDLTGEDFIVSKRHWKDYLILRKILEDEVSPMYPMLIVNFNHLKPTSETIVQVLFDDSDNESSNTSSWEYCRRPSDRFLPKYLEKLREQLEFKGLIEPTKIPNSIDITKISDRVKVVAEIVNYEMNGSTRGDQNITCSDAAVLAHLNELKIRLHCNIIPLGLIRTGAHFERAVLFKALCDQIGLPATLVRGIDGKILYNEVPLPEQADKPDCALTILPMRLLTPTHIVDLMNHPGTLYPIQSRKSYRYQRLL